MLDQILATNSISISELKKNPSAAIDAAGGFAIAVLNRNRASAYLVPAKAWEEILDRLDDIDLAALVCARAGEMPVEANLDQL